MYRMLRSAPVVKALLKIKFKELRAVEEEDDESSAAAVPPLPVVGDDVLPPTEDRRPQSFIHNTIRLKWARRLSFQCHVVVWLPLFKTPAVKSFKLVSSATESSKYVQKPPPSTQLCSVVLYRSVFQVPDESWLQ